MTNENLVPTEFVFSASNQKLKCIAIDKEPWFVAKEICDILGLKNVTVATSVLDADEKAELSLTYVSSNGTSQKRKTKMISESALYALIMRSNKPEARTFRKWVTSEVLPAIRKKGYYSTSYSPTTFLDVRDVPFVQQPFNGFNLRVISLHDEQWFSLTDIHRCIGSQTSITQAVKKLNAKQELAKKMWLFGATHPAWFTNKLGFNLIISGSRVFNNAQLKLL